MPEIAENFIHLAQYITKSGHDLVLFFQKFYDNLRLLLLHKREHVLEILHLFLLLFHSLPHFSFVFSVSRQGSLRLFRLFAISSQIWPPVMLPFFALNGSRTRIS